MPRNLVHVHCRTGSLENQSKKTKTPRLSALPYRQLRKVIVPDADPLRSALPYRQLRNSSLTTPALSGGALPYRQLRNE